MFLSSGHYFFVQWACYTPAMTNLPPSRTADRIMIRLPDGMRDQLSELAKLHGRSVNAEVVARLEESLNRSGPADLAAQLEDVQQKLGSLRGNFIAVLEALRDEKIDEFVNILNNMDD